MRSIQRWLIVSWVFVNRVCIIIFSSLPRRKTSSCWRLRRTPSVEVFRKIFVSVLRAYSKNDLRPLNQQTARSTASVRVLFWVLEKGKCAKSDRDTHENSCGISRNSRWFCGMKSRNEISIQTSLCVYVCLKWFTL